MPGGRRMFLVQMGSIAVGTVLALIISLLDYKDFKVLGIPFYIFTVALLVLVLFIGTGEKLGSRSWLNIMGFSFQPSELAKISMVLVSSIFLERIYDGKRIRLQYDKVFRILWYTDSTGFGTKGFWNYLGIYICGFCNVVCFRNQL